MVRRCCSSWSNRSCPHLTVSLDPVDRRVQWLRLESTGAVLGILSPGDESGPLEHLEVLGHGLQAHVERLGQIVHVGLTRRQPGQKRATGRIGQSGKGGAQRIVRHMYSTYQLFNHIVDYWPRRVRCQALSDGPVEGEPAG